MTALGVMLALAAWLALASIPAALVAGAERLHTATKNGK